MQTLIKKWNGSWPFFLGLITGICFFNLNIMGSRLTFVPGDLGDARLSIYILEHGYLFFTGQTESFWNAPFLYPEENVITYSDNFIGGLPFYLPFRLFGIDAATSFQFWFIVVSALNYTACYFFLKYLFKNKYAAVLGAMIFAFSIGLQSQISHAQTFPRFAIPLALWMGMLYIEQLKPSYFFGMLFFLVYQFYCGIYLGLMLFIPVTLFLLLSLIFKVHLYKVQLLRLKWWLGILAAIGANISLLLPLMLPYLERAEKMKLYFYWEVSQNVLTLRSFFYSYYGSLFWNFLKGVGERYPSFWDHQIFVGGIAMLCFMSFIIVAGSKLFNNKIFSKIAVSSGTVLLLLTSLGTILLFIRYQNKSLYQFVYHLPGFASMRGIQRIINIELVFFAIGTAFIFNLVFRKINKLSAFIFIFFVGLIYADNHIRPENTIHYSKIESDLRVNLLKEKIKYFTYGSVFSYEPDSLKDNVIYYQIDAMLAAQFCKLRTLNGYTSNSPFHYTNYWKKPDEYGRMRWLRYKGISLDKIKVVH